MLHFPDSFTVGREAADIAARLIRDGDQFGHLMDARILFLLSARVPMLHGSPCDALIAQPRSQGPLKWLYDSLLAELCEGEDPDFVVLIDAALWPTWTPEYRERVLYHELRHVVQTEHSETGAPRFDREGRPIWRLVPHDAEFFLDEVERYGPDVCRLEQAAVSIAAGYRRAAERDQRVA